MKKNPFYSLQMISGKPYLLPFGQAVAAQRPGVGLGGSAGFLWSLIDQCADADELVRRAVSEMELNGSEKTEAESDLRSFISGLSDLGIIESGDTLRSAADSAGFYSVLQTGPLRTELRGPEDLFHEDFAPFLAAADPGLPAHQTVAVSDHMPPSQAGLTCLLQNSELEVYHGGGLILLRFPTMPDVSACALSDDGSDAVFYVRPEKNKERLRTDLFHAIRHAFLYRAAILGFYAVHSASVLYRDQVWLFSAPAGTGKSTHAGLWQSSFGTPVLNGDLALLSMNGQGPVFIPVPWCGTSGIALNETHRLGGIVFLKRGPVNSAAVLEPEDRPLRLANRLISPVWTEQMLECGLAFAEELSSRVMMWEHRCTAGAGAAECMKAAVDLYLKEGSADVR